MNVLVVDDHPVLRQGLRSLLTAQASDIRVAEADSLDSAVAAALSLRPQVCVLDLSLGKESGLDLIPRLRAAAIDAAVLVLSVFDESLHAERALRAGARGYLMKESAADQLVDAVQRVARGEIVVSAPVHARLLAVAIGGDAARSGEAALSAREREILDLVGRGLSSQQIAERMSRSVKTIETHRGNIQRKLRLDCALQLVRYATLRLGH